jgi:hypothetical protein
LGEASRTHANDKNIIKKNVRKTELCVCMYVCSTKENINIRELSRKYPAILNISRTGRVALM